MKIPGSLTQLWSRLWQKPKNHWLLGIPCGGFAAFVAGILFWGGLHWAVEATNTLAFCISCHEMEASVYQEYLASPHYKNASGVSAVCTDCHVPKEWGPKMLRKIKATNELYHKLMGTIDTQEKFEAHRLELAQMVWDEMKQNNSRECRNCHSYDAMDPQLQESYARRKHSREWHDKTGDSCIDCHKGIAHKLPALTEQ